MSTDRMAYLAACESEAAGKVAPEYQPAPLPGHDDEIRARHEGRPTITEQDKRNGAGLPAVDNGPDPRGGAR